MLSHSIQCGDASLLTGLFVNMFDSIESDPEIPYELKLEWDQLNSLNGLVDQ